MYTQTTVQAVLHYALKQNFKDYWLAEDFFCYTNLKIHSTNMLLRR